MKPPFMLTDRRKLLAGLPSVGAALVMPTTVRAEEHATPILRLYHQHKAINEAAERHTRAAFGNEQDAELDRMYRQHTDRIEAEIMALPCTCAADFAAKVIVDTCQGNIFSDWETGAIWVEARALIGGAI